MEIVKREDREQILVTKELCHDLTIFKVTEEDSVIISRTDDARVVVLSVQNNSDDYDRNGERSVVLTPEELRAIGDWMINYADGMIED